MIVEASKLNLSVSLISKSSLRIELAELDRSLTPERESVGHSQSNKETFLNSSVSVEVLSEIPGKVSVRLVNFV